MAVHRDTRINEMRTANARHSYPVYTRYRYKWTSSISHRIIRINLFVAVVFLHHSFIRFHGCLRKTMQSNKYKENKRFNSILPNETDSRTPREKERNRWRTKKQNWNQIVKHSNLTSKKKVVYARRTWSVEQTSRWDLRRLHLWVATIAFQPIQIDKFWFCFFFFSFQQK